MQAVNTSHRGKNARIGVEGMVWGKKGEQPVAACAQRRRCCGGRIQAGGKCRSACRGCGGACRGAGRVWGACRPAGFVSGISAQHRCTWQSPRP